MIFFGYHQECGTFYVTTLASHSIILGHDWLVHHNPEINWATGEVKMSRCPCVCRTCRDEVRQESKLRRIEARRIQRHKAQPFPVLIEELEDKDNAHESSPSTDDCDISGSDRDPSPEPDAVEEGDHIFWDF